MSLHSLAQEGYWRGDITKNNKIWSIAIEFVKENGAVKASIDFIDVNGYGRMFSVTRNQSSLHLERAQPKGGKIAFDGTIDGDIFTGSWSGIGIDSATFRLRKTNKPAIKQIEVGFSNKEATLSGTLLLPEGKGKFPVIIFMHGGAPEDRMAYWGPAMQFLAKGIAALIYDKRGVGKSRGGDWQQDGLTALADDALAAVDLLKKRTDIDAKQIAVFGHSEGGWTAPLAASKSRDISFLIVSGVSSVAASEQTIYHRHNVMLNDGFDAATISRAEQLWRQLYGAAKLCATDTLEASRLKTLVNDSIEKVHNEPWFASAALPYPYDTNCPTAGVMELLFQDPLSVWRKIKMPVFAIWGEKDIVVPVQESERDIRKALTEAGNNHAEFVVMPNVNHGYLLENLQKKEWDFPRMEKGYFETIVKWLKEETVSIKS